MEDLNGVYVVASIDSGSKNIYMNSFNLATTIDTLNEWQEFKFLFPVLVQTTLPDCELKLYIWNNGRKISTSMILKL
ncbi:MAG: hypothetical protein HOO91_12225 [Bacteroidales bacterium]|nr:hypothetical protein [Bacteroidales bacterium]